MKHLFTFLFLALGVCAQAKTGNLSETTPDAESIFLGYGAGTVTNSQGNATQKQVGAAIELPRATVNFYKNNQISAVRLCLTITDQIDSVKVFVTEDLNGDPLVMEKSTECQANQWNQVELGTPVTITDKPLYVGYYIWSKGFPMGMRVTQDGNKALGNWYNDKGRWNHLEKGSQDYVFAIEAVVTGDYLPAYNAALQTVDVPKYLVSKQRYNLQGTLLNKAVKTITELEVACTVKGVSKTYKCSGLDIPYNESGNFEIKGFTTSETGNYDIAIEIIKINGNSDSDANDNKLLASVICRDKFQTRNVLVENMTSEFCTTCPRAHELLEKACEGMENIVRIEHHAGFIEDQFSLDKSWEIFRFFSPAYSFAPSLFLDRTDLSAYGASTGYSDTKSPIIMFESAKADKIKEWINACAEIPAYVTLTLDVEYNEKSRQAHLTVTGEDMMDIADARAYLNIYVTEDSVFTATQSSGGEKYYHRHMTREILTPTWGDEVSLSSAYSKEYEFTIPAEWNAEKVQFVAFMSNYDPEDAYNCKIYNADAKWAITPDKVCNPVQTASLKVYKQGNGILKIEGECTHAEAYTLNGIRIGSSADGSDLMVDPSVKGVVIVKLYSKDGVKNCKVVL